MQDHEMPSPRESHCCWDYGDKMWIFGGYGESPAGYLNDYGDHEEKEDDCWRNNQLLSFDPSVRTWKSMKCFGHVPSPRDSASVAVIKEKCWLYGGYTTLD